MTTIPKTAFHTQESGVSQRQYRIRQILPNKDILYSQCATDNIRTLKWNLWRLRDKDDMSKYAIVDEAGNLYPQLLIDAIAEDLAREANWKKRMEAKAIAQKERNKVLAKRL
jgi:hypothetical protein